VAAGVAVARASSNQNVPDSTITYNRTTDMMTALCIRS
jgi:hypothetical protein